MEYQNDLLHELEVLVKSRYGVIFLETPEEERAGSLLTLLAGRLELPFFSWKITEGLRRKDIQTGGPVYGSTDVSVAIDHILSSGLAAIYHFRGFNNFLDDFRNVNKLRELALRLSKITSSVIITGDGLTIPNILKPLSSLVTVPPPGINQYRNLLNNIIRDLNLKSRPIIELGEKQTNQLLNNVKGLTLTEAEKILTRVIIEDNRLSVKDINAVLKAKKKIIEKEGVLEYLPVE